ncbi:MAG: aquaporin Z [Acidimicrobiales bacterium]|nr:aquaporin Z [Acidimicrobiales bacterium]
MDIQKRLGAEAFGTFWLVLGGCGTAIFAAGVPDVGVGFLGVALAFGLTVVTMAYAVGHISGGHFNPAVTVGLLVSGRFDKKDALPYILAQVIGAVLAGAVLYLIANGQDGFEIDNSLPGAFAANGYGDLSPGGYGLVAALVAEVVLTAFFLIVILGATAKRAVPAMGGLAIGLALTLIHLISIPITNTSVNPARSTSQALFAGGDFIPQLWLFWVAPIAGAALGAIAYKALLEDPQEHETLAEGQ